MKSLKKRKFFSLTAVSLLFCVLMVVTGCGQTRESKTMLLPDTEQEEQNPPKGETSESYTVKKIYTQEYDSGVPGGFTAFLPGSKEHQVTLLQKNDDNGLNLISMDYRYGFYETRYTVSEEVLLNSDWWAGAGKEGSWLLFGEFSPDGRYFLYIRCDQTYTGERLYLRDLESGEEMILLDGDVQQCPYGEFKIMTAWDAEDSLLCYGFYPANQDVWMNNTDQCVFHFMDLEKQEEVASLNYFYAELYAKPEDLRKTGISIDRDGEELLTAIVSEMEGTEGVWVDFYQQKLLEDGNEGTVAVKPIPIIHDKKLNVRPDAKNQCFYGTYTDGSQGGILFGDFQNQWDDQLTGSPITDYLVLDDGKTIITAETPPDQIEQEICLYTKNGDAYIPHLLYKGNGNVLRLQYDPVYHRLLAELGDDIDSVNGSPMGGERGLVILEFE